MSATDFSYGSSFAGQKDTRKQPQEFSIIPESSGRQVSNILNPKELDDFFMEIFTRKKFLTFI